MKCFVMNCRGVAVVQFGSEKGRPFLCQRHFDTWMESGERTRYETGLLSSATSAALNDFLQRMQMEDQRAREIDASLRSDVPEWNAKPDFDVTYPSPIPRVCEDCDRVTCVCELTE